MSLCEKQKRKCLKCGKDFQSTGAYNRICGPCNGLNTKVHTSPQFTLGGVNTNGGPTMRAGGGRRKFRSISNVYDPIRV